MDILGFLIKIIHISYKYEATTFLIRPTHEGEIREKPFMLNDVYPLQVLIPVEGTHH